MGGKIIESPWVETNNALKQKFDGFAAEHKTKSAPIPDLLLFQDDYLIKQWILSLNSLTQRLEALISQVNTSWQQDSAEEEKIHGMLLELYLS
ncbi:hypothetical protein [Legionella maceachernii]|uniref:Uncharacterized protein n=1 Tax=Legionella maceachernii TaxID=466 RepID=A0A0W0WG34_9GAMM|nr:hypothetical protein [Legionella maceachernii]KTD31285.1 hypothetical protein Lmac_0339 [Legionella maceachernii]SKA00545.1 hypothetical protein SAMN02745128_01749 [Legionella maceachernii]SUP01344.1 Uncharacterised protein [Legionella maceachernii]